MKGTRKPTSGIPDSGRLANTEVRECPFCGKQPVESFLASGKVLCDTKNCAIEMKTIQLLKWNRRSPAAAGTTEGEGETR